MTVSWLAMPARKTSAFVVVWSRVKERNVADDSQVIGGDGEDLLEDECGKETFKGIKAGTAKGLVKGVPEGGRDELPEVKVFVQKLKKGRGIILKHVLTLGKGFF